MLVIVWNGAATDAAFKRKGREMHTAGSSGGAAPGHNGLAFVECYRSGNGLAAHVHTKVLPPHRPLRHADVDVSAENLLATSE